MFQHSPKIVEADTSTDTEVFQSIAPCCTNFQILYCRLSRISLPRSQYYPISRYPAILLTLIYPNNSAIIFSLRFTPHRKIKDLPHKISVLMWEEMRWMWKLRDPGKAKRMRIISNLLALVSGLLQTPFPRCESGLARKTN